MTSRKTRIQKIVTVRDVRIAKLRADAIRFPETKPVVLTDSRIGQLCRRGKTVFYAYVNGIYLEGAADVLAAKLGAQS